MTLNELVFSIVSKDNCLITSLSNKICVLSRKFTVKVKQLNVNKRNVVKFFSGVPPKFEFNHLLQPI